MHRTGKYSQHSSITRPGWRNGWVFVYKLSGCRFEFCCSHLNFSRYGAFFKQGVPWHSGNYKVWIHSETRTWHDKNMHSNALHRQVLTAQLNHLASLAKWLSVCLQTRWFWVSVPLQSLKRHTLWAVSTKSVRLHILGNEVKSLQNASHYLHNRFLWWCFRECILDV